MIAFLLPNGVPHFTVLRARRNALKIVLVDRRPGLRGGKGGKIFKGGRCSKWCLWAGHADLFMSNHSTNECIGGHCSS